MNWFSSTWFSYPTLREFEWAQRYFLYLLPTIPLVFALRRILAGRTRQRLPVASITRELRSGWIESLRHLPALLTGVGMTLLLVALARPQRVSQRIERSSEGIDIVLAIDISDSMLESDLQPNRLEAAKRVARSFVQGRFEDRIGLVVFAGDAFSLCPLTTDYDLLNQSIGEVNSGLIRTAGTAIGSALGTSTNRLRDSKTKSKIIVLLSDGENTAGSLDPITAAELAQAYGIRLYTIAVGRDGISGETPTDEGTLKRLADIANGQFFRATDTQTLTEVFARIDRLEKTEIKQSRYREVTDFYQVYLRWAIVFLLLALFMKSTFVGNVLED